MIITSSIIFPFISNYSLSSFDISMIVLSIGSGSIMISHINDSYFWIVTNKTNLPEAYNLLNIPKALQIDPSSINDNKNIWIEEWLNAS